MNIKTKHNIEKKLGNIIKKKKRRESWKQKLKSDKIAHLKSYIFFPSGDMRHWSFNVVENVYVVCPI